MALTEQDLVAIDATFAQAPGDGDLGRLIGELRHRFPDLRWLRCDASDVLEEPWRSYAGVDLHLVDASSHCATMTNDPECASGILLAAKVAA